MIIPCLFIGADHDTFTEVKETSSTVRLMGADDAKEIGGLMNGIIIHKLSDYLLESWVKIHHKLTKRWSIDVTYFITLFLAEHYTFLSIHCL